jgi:hypothetical protein
MDSFEQSVHRNAFEPSRLFGSPEERAALRAAAIHAMLF